MRNYWKKLVKIEDGAHVSESDRARARPPTKNDSLVKKIEGYSLVFPCKP
jgi:hypothetical protein